MRLCHAAADCRYLVQRCNDKHVLIFDAFRTWHIGVSHCVSVLLFAIVKIKFRSFQGDSNVLLLVLSFPMVIVFCCWLRKNTTIVEAAPLSVAFPYTRTFPPQHRDSLNEWNRQKQIWRTCFRGKTAKYPFLSHFLRELRRSQSERNEISSPSTALTRSTPLELLEVSYQQGSTWCEKVVLLLRLRPTSPHQEAQKQILKLCTFTVVINASWRFHFWKLSKMILSRDCAIKSCLHYHTRTLRAF